MFVLPYFYVIYEEWMAIMSLVSMDFFELSDFLQVSALRFRQFRTEFPLNIF